MAHFAELDNNNIVIRVVVVNNDVIVDETGNESELKGIEFLQSLYGSGRWIQTSYNNSFRKKFASIDDTFDEINDRFISPQPYPSWIFDEESNSWQPPVAFPSDYTKKYDWNESSQTWDERP